MMIIAIDGPAAAGKGTLARRLAEALDLAFLDTGALYRATALQLLRAGHGAEDEAAAEACAKSLDHRLLDDPALRDEAVGSAASTVASYPQVRSNLLEFQRNFAQNPPGGEAGAVLDGRDVGTVVCPDAPLKLFVTASDEVRARRRFEELSAKGVNTSYADVLADLQARDARDRARAAAPLVPAADAHLIDTSELDIDAVFSRAMALVRQTFPDQV